MKESPADALARLLDERAIERVYVRYCELVDVKDFAGLDEVFTPDTRGDYTQALGEGVVTEGLATLVAAMEANLGAGSRCGATSPSFPISRARISVCRTWAVPQCLS